MKSKLLGLLALICFLTLFLFMGESHFHTCGEPREALVAVAMLQDGNWTLPITNGTDIAYKPPLFHWAIATVSSVIGKVTEYTSRMPSAIALTAMILTGFLFYARRRGTELAFLASLIALSNFELHRAGVNCRVDMLLSALMVLALYQLYKWYEKKLRGIPWWAILCLSGAFLTKGPVGLILPCIVVALFAWIRGINFFRILFSFAGVAIAACLLPALWYIAAWRQGGDRFLALVIEENVLRFLGKMTYASHENPWYYNVMTITMGFVPYSLLLLISLFTLKYTRFSIGIKEGWRQLVKRIREMDDTRLFSLLSIVIMFVFYCIPKSKRSVYLLPVYPFIAYFIAEYVIWLVKHKPQSVKCFNDILCVSGIVLTVIFAIVRMGWIPDSFLGGKAANLAYLHALETLPLGMNLIPILLPVAVAILYFRSKNGGNRRLMYGGVAMTFALFFALDGVYQPTVLNVKSNKSIAERVNVLVPEGNIYSYVTFTIKHNRMHPFTLNYYLDNRVVPFVDFAPTEGYLFIDEKEYDGFMENYGNAFFIEELPDSRFKSNDNREWMHIYHFKKKQS